MRPYTPKEALIQFPSLWLPGSPLPSSRGLGRRCCCVEDCPNLCTGSIPQQIEVTITGVQDGTCDECAAYWNDVFIIDLYAFFRCSYLLQEAGLCDALQATTLFCVWNTQDNFEVRMSSHLPPAGGAVFRKTLTACTIDSETIPFISSSDTGCDFSAATVVVDSI